MTALVFVTGWGFGIITAVAAIIVAARAESPPSTARQLQRAYKRQRADLRKMRGR